MSLSMYDASIPLFKQLLGTMSAVLDKGAAHAEAKKVDPAVLMQTRLVVDMLPLMKQVQIATDMVKGGAARLAGVEIPSYPDDEKTIDDAKARIAKTVAFLDSIKPEQINGSEAKEINIKAGTRELHFKGQAYLLHWVIPNFTFHCTTAYNLLRENGVDIGKRDFLGAV